MSTRGIGFRRPSPNSSSPSELGTTAPNRAHHATTQQRHSKSNYQPSDLRRCGTGSKPSPATRRQSFLTEQSRRPSHAGHSGTRALKTSHAEREFPPVARTPDLRWLRPPGRMPPCRLLTLLSFVVVLLSWPVRGPSRCLRWRRICGFLSRVCGIGWPRPMPMNAGARRA
jgi:hypothetical protein